MQRPASRIQYWQIDPAKVILVARRPDDRRDAFRRQIERQDRMNQFLRIWKHIARRKILGQVQSGVPHMPVHRRQKASIGRIPMREVGCQIGSERHFFVFGGQRAPDEQNTVGGEAAEVDRMPPASAADHQRGMIGRTHLHGGFVHAERAQPPDHVPPAISARQAPVRTDRQIHAPPGQLQLLRDLRTGRTGADHQHTAGRQLAGIAVAAGMHLNDPAH